ncbi:MAG: 4-(cytidine 5'-diphospho)-2-C-methyl-D-erythritol kinase [Candidatus Aminicenantes bacterium]
MRVKSFAKINLGLEVIGKRDDDYHDLRTLLQAVDFHDTLTFEALSSDLIALKGNDPSIPWDRRNLVYRAAAALKERFRVAEGIDIFVDKNIPAGRGLGGGSSNAAMTLYALNKVWSLHADKRELAEIGQTLGVDVPYFLEGGLCLGTGRGDELSLLEDLEPLPCVLVIPDMTILTSTVYEQLPPLTSRSKDSKIIKFLDSHDFGLLENSLEETVFNLNPQLKDIKRLLYKLGSELSLLCGSGSAIFGLFRKKGTAVFACERLKKRYSLRLVTTLSRAQYWDGVEGWGVAKR